MIRDAMSTIKDIILFILLTSPIQTSYAESAASIVLNIDNTRQSLNDYKGKLVYLDFWASWCIPCRKSFPFMNEMQSKYKDKGLEIIAINLDTDITLVRKFLKQYPAQFKIAYDSTGDIAENLILKQCPPHS